MKLTENTISAFRRVNCYGDCNCVKSQANIEEYKSMLKQVMDEVGDEFSFADAKALCHMGFFVTHKNFAASESMHSYGGYHFYEDGACLTTSGMADSPYDWMEEGWYVKVTPDKVDFEKLRYMHRHSRGMCLSGNSYEDCIIKQ